MQYPRIPASHRELEVLYLLAHENTTKEIASQLNLSMETIKSHRKNLMRKWNVKNVAGLVRRGFELGELHATESLQ